MKTFEEISNETGVPVAELIAHSRKLEARYAALGDPTPGPLAAAFPGTLAKCCGFAIRPIVAADFPILRQLNAPMIRQMMEATKPAETRQKVEYTDAEGWELILQFTRCLEDVEALFAQGVPAFRQAAVEQIGRRMNLFVTVQLVKAIDDMIGDSFKTALGFEASSGKEESFSKPPADQATASVGGSTTLPSSPSNADSPAAKP